MNYTDHSYCVCSATVNKEVGGNLTRYGLGLDDVWLTCQRLRKPSPSATPHYKNVSEESEKWHHTKHSCYFVCVPYCPGSWNRDGWLERCLLVWSKWVAEVCSIQTSSRYHPEPQSCLIHSQTRKRKGERWWEKNRNTKQEKLYNWLIHVNMYTGESSQSSTHSTDIWDGMSFSSHCLDSSS